MTDDRWRCFVAIPIGEALRAELRLAVAGWRGHDGLRWTDPEGWHVTLAFLGSVEPASVAGFVERLTTVAESHSALESTTGGLGAFPTPARARVAWYGVEDGEGRLASLAFDVAAALGLEAPMSFRPHVTLARARRQPVDLRPWLASASAPKSVLVTDRIQSMRSYMGRGQAHYGPLATIRLAVSAGV